MPPSPRPSLLRRLIGLPAADAEPDAADMGTAIGMEYSMDQQALAPNTPPPASPPAGGGAQRTGWLAKRRGH